MSEQKHTPEPWGVSEGYGDYGSKSFGVSAKAPYHCVVPNLNINPEDARRIVACVNACAGIDTDALEEHGVFVGSQFKSLSDDRYDIRKQRDDLLAENAELKKLSVTNIMIDVVPGGDDSGEEVYAKSVEDVVNLLTSLGEKAEDFDLKNAPLKKQCEGVEMSFLEMEQTISCQQMEIEDLKRTIDEQKDAERYRWLRNKAFTEDSDGGYVKYYVLPKVCYANAADYIGHKPYYYKSLDGAIDAAIGGEKK